MSAGTLLLQMPEAASTIAPMVDGLYWFIAALSTVFFVIIVGATALFIRKYRYREGDTRPVSRTKGNHALEIAWSVIPGVFLMVIFAWGFAGFVAQAVPPDNSMNVRVTAQKWNWNFGYPRQGGINSPKLVVPVNQPVKLTMSSVDVLHSFYVPAFRVKQDVVPGRYTVVWFEATKPGIYDVFCTEYCGTSHSDMLSTVEVLSHSEFDEWVASGGGMGGEGMDPVAWGEMLYTAQGCNACHSIDGTKGIGPTWKGIYGAQESLTTGESVVVDDNYIRESIVSPMSKITAGYQPVMPPYAGRLSDAQIDALIDYIASLE